MRPTTILRAAALAALLAISAAPAAAQDGAAPQTTPAVEVAAPPADSPPAAYGADAAVSQAAGIPARPQTLRPYWHVFAAFTLAWLFLFGYVVALSRRFGRLERELEAARG